MSLAIDDEVQLLVAFRVFRVHTNGNVDICDSEGNCLTTSPSQVSKLKQTDMKAMKDAVLTVATALAKANNTVTTLEIKTELRRDYPYYFWTQDVVSKYMDQLAGDGVFTYTDNGTFRTYSLANQKRRVATAPLSKTVKAGRKTANTVSATQTATGLKVRRTKIDNTQLLSFANHSQFVAVVLANGTTVTKDNIKAQKKSPVGYISPKQGRIASIIVGTNQYNVK